MNIGLSNTYVTNLCKKLMGSYFISTFPCDLLLEKTKTLISKIKQDEGFSLVVNMSPSSFSGSHFIALSYRSNHLILFDSLALPYKDPNINLFVQAIQKSCNVTFTSITHHQQLQPFESLMCGYYVCAYCLHQSKNEESPKEFVKLFYEDKKKNDSVVIRYITDFISNL